MSATPPQPISPFATPRLKRLNCKSPSLRTAAASALVLLTVGVFEWQMGRSLLGPDGRLGLWQGDIWNSECSQRLADPYSFSHVVHGVLFYFGLWLVGRRWPTRTRFFLATLSEAGWELLENSPIIINRYRHTALALGYDGDSIVNSLSDIAMMAIGFVIAARARPWQALLLVVLMELGCLYWIRDNLTLNVINLIHPVPSIERWQTAARPASLVPDRHPAFHSPTNAPKRETKVE